VRHPQSLIVAWKSGERRARSTPIQLCPRCIAQTLCRTWPNVTDEGKIIIVFAVGFQLFYICFFFHIIAANDLIIGGIYYFIIIITLF
jgi:hypothetical protein